MALLGLSQAAVAQPAARSGLYDTLTLAVAGSTVSGAFFDQRGVPGPGGAPPFSCLFLLRGSRVGDIAQVATWVPGDVRSIPGELRFTTDGATLKLAGAHGGCGMTSGDMVARPYAVARGAEGADWREVGMVAAKRSVFHREPGIPAPHAPFVVRFDPIVILDRRADWVRARYLGGAQPLTGWLRATDLAPSEPPPAR